MSGPAGSTVVVGDVNDDVVVIPLGPRSPDSDTPSLVRSTRGGSAANQAVWLAAQGVAVRLAARVSAERSGSIAAALRRDGVEAWLGADPVLPTGTVVVIVGEGGTRAMYTDRGANAALSAPDLPASVLDGAAHLHVSGYALAGGPARAPLAALCSLAAGRGVAVTLDPGSEAELASWPGGPWDLLAPVLDSAPLAVMLPNLGEGRVLTGLDGPEDVARSLSERAGVVTVKLGAGGVVVAERGGEPVGYPAAPVEVVDPTGAGDAFAAGFLASWRRHEPLDACALAGIRLAGEAVSGIGAQPLTPGEG